MIGRAGQHIARSQHFGIRLLRFGSVGAATGLVFAGLVALMVDGVGLRESHAAGLAYLALLPPNFLAHKHSVFRSRQPALPEVLRYLGMHAIALLSSMAVMAALTGPLGMSHWVGSVVVIGVVPLISLALMELWVFPGRSRHLG